MKLKLLNIFLDQALQAAEKIMQVIDGRIENKSGRDKVTDPTT